MSNPKRPNHNGPVPGTGKKARKGASNKEVDKILKEVRRQGWTVDRLGNHFRATNPANGEFVVIAGTPSDHHAIQNIRAALRQRGFQDRKHGKRE